MSDQSGRGGTRNRALVAIVGLLAIVALVVVTKVFLRGVWFGVALALVAIIGIILWMNSYLRRGT